MFGLGRLLALILLFWAGLATGRAEALPDAEFLSLCAGERGYVVPQTLKKALADGANVNFTGPRGMTPLMAFVSAHREADREALAALKVLLAAGPNLEAHSEEGGTALGYAILNQAGPRVISALLTAGAEVGTPIGPQGSGLPPLLLAAGLEPDPLVSALLWIDGAGREFQENRRELLAQAEGRPEVLRLLTGALEADSEEGLPYFTATPADPGLRERLKEMDDQFRPPRNEEDAWLDYLQWQIDLPTNLGARRELFGRTETEAWIDEYTLRLTAAEPGLAPRPRDRIILPGPRPSGAAIDALAAADRQVIVLLYDENLLVAYEKDSGRELWRRRPNGPTRIMPVGRLVLAATAWGGGLGEALVLDPLTGAVLLELPDLDAPKWIVDAGRRALIISTDLTLDILDLNSWKSRRWTWHELLNTQGWDEASRMARTFQNTILTEYGEGLDEEGRFARPGGDLFHPPPPPSRAALDRIRASLMARGYTSELVILAAEKKSQPSFIVGPACRDACGRAEAATSLVLVNPARNRLDYLAIPGPADAPQYLTRGHLAASEEEARIQFSPDGALLAVTEDTGAVHFFNARTQGRHLGVIPHHTALAEGAAVGDLRLLALLADDQPPLALFYDPADDRHFLVEANPNGVWPQPLDPGTGIGLTAWAATAAGHWAAGLSDGSLWLMSPDRPAPSLLAAPPGAPWSALAFSGDGRTLAAASGREVRLFRGGRPEHKSTLAGEVGRLALDPSGRWLWAGLTFSGNAPNPALVEGRFSIGRPALAMVDWNAPGHPLYKAAIGPVLALRPSTGGVMAIIDPTATEAALVAEDPAPEQDEDEALDQDYTPVGEDKPRGPARTAERWLRGRADLWPFDQLRPTGILSLHRPGRLFAGLTQTELFHQEKDPDRPYFMLSREGLTSRRPGRLTAGDHQRRLSPAAFDSSGRLAAFPELDGGSLHVFNLASGRKIAHGPAGDPEGLLGAAFLQGSSRILTFGQGGLVRLWSLKESRPLLTWAFAEGGRWAAVTPEGLFDASHPNETDHILRSVGRSPALPLYSFAGDSLRPGLSASLLSRSPSAD